MTTIITITSSPVTVLGSGYDYTQEDRILQNIMTNEYEVFYSGQNQGRADHQLIESVESRSPFRIYYRRRAADPFIYLGQTEQSSIIRERFMATGINTEPSERLQIRLVVSFENIINEQVNTLFEGSGKYKKAVLSHSNFRTNQNLNVGFYKQ